jgi:uncharacterized metal-binding protein (TIGR02443 family)
MTEPLPDMPKRFIAGAKCSKCRTLDRVVMYRRAGVQYQECVNCGHQESMTFESNFRELETRVNRTLDEKHRDLAVVRILGSDSPGN